MKKKKVWEQAELVLPKIMLHFLIKFFPGTMKTYHKAKNNIAKRIIMFKTFKAHCTAIIDSPLYASDW